MPVIRRAQTGSAPVAALAGRRKHEFHQFLECPDVRTAQLISRSGFGIPSGCLGDGMCHIADEHRLEPGVAAAATVEEMKQRGRLPPSAGAILSHLKCVPSTYLRVCHFPQAPPCAGLAVHSPLDHQTSPGRKLRMPTPLEAIWTSIFASHASSDR